MEKEILVVNAATGTVNIDCTHLALEQINFLLILFRNVMFSYERKRLNLIKFNLFFLNWCNIFIKDIFMFLPNSLALYGLF